MKHITLFALSLFAVLGSVNGHCECLFEGSTLPPDLFNHFPEDAPGKYKDMAAIAKYGSMCAAWDSVPGTPWHEYCPSNASFGEESHNWCQVPWCYVSPECPSAQKSDVFKGSVVAYYSYDACGVPNCYDDFHTHPDCPFDPYKDGSYRIFKDDCKCTYHGEVLPSDIYTNYPTDEPGKYKDLDNVNLYGSTCAQWDLGDNTPFAEYCPRGSDWCSIDMNWCSAPWCYVDSSCSTGNPSDVFKGSGTAYYSYDTCMDTPNCYNKDDNDQYNEMCPFNCDQWKECKCKFEGHRLPDDVILNYPSEDPGKYQNSATVSMYGTMCAAWDSIPGTPWHDYCPSDADFSTAENNWCQVPWCYVDEKCPSGAASDVFNGSDVAYFSYDACSMPDCYNDFNDNEDCPFDPYKDNKYRVFKDDCKCIHHGSMLPEDVVENYPSDDPGKYKDVANVRLYGSTCASWDLSPNSPWSWYCPQGADWCTTEHNWCSAPWCYVDEHCASGNPSSVFKGSPTSYYSYDTCMDTPNCFDTDDNGRYAEHCPFACEHWTVAPHVHDDSCETMEADTYTMARSKGYLPRGCPNLGH